MKKRFSIFLLALLLCACLIIAGCDKEISKRDDDDEDEETELSQDDGSLGSSDTDASDGTDGSNGETTGSDGNTDSTDGNTDTTGGNTDSTGGNTDSTGGNTDSTGGNTDSTDGSTGSSGEDLPHQHNYSTGKITTLPTCTEAGQIEQSCSCGDVIYLPLNPKGHSEEILPGTATCTEGGLSEGKRCTVCGEVILEQTEIGPLGHDYGEWEEITAPTCTEGGEQKRVCFCGETELSAIGALGHKQIVIDGKDATCTESGLAPGIGCERCGAVILEQAVTDALNHLPSSDGTCTRCGEAADNKAILLAIDVSSSMKEFMSSGTSRFTELVSALKAAILEMPSDVMIGIVAFDANLHIILEPQYIPSADRENLARKVERALNKTYYLYYLDGSGAETEIPVGYNDGDAYTSLGLVRPEIQYPNNYDRQTGILIKTYGTAYYPPIEYAQGAFDSFFAIEKSLVFVSDGAPSDVNSGYLDIIANMASEGIVTSTLCVGNLSSNIEELNKVCQNGGGVAYAANDPVSFKRDLFALLNIPLPTKTDENGFVFYENDGTYYLVGYTGNESDLVLPELFEGEPYELISNSLTGLDFVHSITFPSNITSIPTYAVKDCAHLYTLKFLAESTYVSSNSFSGCPRIYEIYGAASGACPGYYRHSSLEDESFVKIQENGLVFGIYNEVSLDVIDYLGNEEDLRIDIPAELIADYFRFSARIFNYAFSGCDLKSITLDSHFSSVSSYAFENCSELSRIILESAVSFASSNIFKGCTSLEFIIAPAFSSGSVPYSESLNVTLLCTNACSISTNWPLIENCTDYGITGDGFKWAKSSNFEGVILCGYSGQNTVLTIPDKIGGAAVTAIYDCAFKNRAEITSLTMPSTVSYVGRDAFYGCTGIIELIDGIAYVGTWVVGCTAQDAIISSSAVGIASGAFRDNSQLLSVYVPTSVKYINKNALVNCRSAVIYFAVEEELDTWDNNWNPGGNKMLFGICQEHSWVEASCTEPKHCENCPITVGDISHTTSKEQSCEGDVFCDLCGTLIFKKLAHTTEDGLTCSRCGTQLFLNYKIGLDDIESITASHTGGGAPNLEKLFDGDKTTVGIFSGSDSEYYPEAVGDSFTIVLKEQETATDIIFWCAGNWTTATLYFYNEYGSVVKTTEIVYNGAAYGGDSVPAENYDTYGEILSDGEAVTFKSIKIECTSLKWGDGKLQKTSEVEIFVLREATQE